jgi:hypothetical protein
MPQPPLSKRPPQPSDVTLLARAHEKILDSIRGLESMAADIRQYLESPGRVAAGQTKKVGV